MIKLSTRTLRRLQIAGLAALTVAGTMLISPRAGAEDPTTQPATQPTSQPMAKTVDALTGDLAMQFGNIQEVMGTPDTLMDSTKRAAVAPKVVPALKRMVADLDALVTADPDHKQDAVAGRAEYRMFLALFGDEDANKLLATEAASTDAPTALEGKRGQLMVSWINDSSDPAAQAGVADQIEKLARENPTSTELTMQLFRMSQLGSSTPDLTKRLQAIVTDVMKNEVADQAKQQLAGEQKLAALENKPITIAGKLVDGKAFTSDAWKGKVVLVDFWATWCGPCLQELPRVAKMYADYHAKGLEVLGVSNDNSAEDLTKFLAEHKEMPWPQLFDADAAKNQQWNPITTGFGIDGIPTMFLIDKKGICRSVSARSNMEELIPKMLDEK